MKVPVERTFAGAVWHLDPSKSSVAHFVYINGLCILRIDVRDQVASLQVEDVVQLMAKGSDTDEAIANLEKKLSVLRGLLEFK